jgi:endonuclease III
MNLKEKAKKIAEIFTKAKTKTTTDLHYNNPIQLLVAVILSAQCTDVRVNSVTKELFKKYKNVDDFANADLDVFKEEIRSTGFYNNKAKNILATSKMIKKSFNNKVPDSMEELLKLPGVARKTANVILSSVYNKTEGIVVDTHVKRLSYRIGLTKNENPNKIEQDLMKILEKKYWNKFSHFLIQHGRKICSARKPLCDECMIKIFCAQNGI